MKRISTFLAGLLCAVAVTFADAPFRNHRYDAFKVLPVNSEQIVFIGNSITNMHEWWEAFDDHNVINRGVSGAVTDEALANIEAIASGKPKKVFIMLGTNDLGTAGINTTEHVLANMTLIVERLQQVSPTTSIYIQSILPSGKRNLALQQETNTALQTLCNEKSITYIDLWDDLQGVVNNANGLSYDNLHLTADAYKIWCDKIAPYVTGKENTTSVYTDATQVNGGLGGSYGMRTTVFSKLPVNSDDILMIGDEMIHGGEWHELLQSPRVKNRGTAWGYPGPSIAQLQKMIPAILHNDAAPAQIFLYTGVGPVNGESDLESIITSYKNTVKDILELSPTTKVTLMSLQPTKNATTNTTRVVPFNSAIEAYANATTNVEYLDIYTDFVTQADVANTDYFVDNYLYGKGYVKVAQKVAAQINALDPAAQITVLTDEEANTAYTRFNHRTALGNAIVKASLLPEGDAVGQYRSTDIADVKAKVTEAYEALESSTTATDTFTDELTALNEATAALLPKINMPEYSTEDNEVWYQLYTPNRGTRYLKSNGAGVGVTGEEINNYPSSMWKFVMRDGGDVDIVNRHDNSYLAPTAAYNNQITTVATQPNKGWTLSYSNSAGLFIVSSGTVQLNQTQQSLGYKVYNWSANQTGADRNDAGCQYKVALVQGNPDEEPVEEQLEGNLYYFAANTKQSDGTYVNRYLYVNANGALATSTEFLLNNNSYTWELIANGTDSYHIKNGTGKYLSYANKSLNVNDAAYSFQLKDDAIHTGIGAKSLYNPTSSGGKYMVMEANGNSFNQYGTPVNNGSWCSDYLLTPVEDIKGFTLNVVSNITAAEPLFSWNGEEFSSSTIFIEGSVVNKPTLTLVSHNTAYQFDGFYSDGAFTKPLGNPYDITSLTENKTIYAKFTLQIFSSSIENLVPVQIFNHRNNSYTIRLNESANYSGHTVNSGVNSFVENDIWYFVGNASSFKMYNRMAGMNLALKLASNDRDAAATMAPAAEASALTLVEQSGSYAICPVGTTGQSLNMHGGNGNDIKLYNTSDGGSTWQFNRINEHPVRINFNASLDGGHELNTRIAEVSIKMDGTTGNARWSTGNLEQEQYYLPVGATFSMSVNTIYRGWNVDFNGITEQILPAEGLSVEVNISVDKNNKYLYLAYSRDDVHNKPYRIPAIATARNGHVIAVYDYRPCANDVGAGEVDIMFRRSEDHGTTWTEEVCIANGVGGTQNVFNAGFGDAAIVADRESDNVLVMHVGGKQFFPYATATSHNAVGRIRSTDNGKTWSDPVDISAQFMSIDSNVSPILPGSYSMFFASGRILQSRVYKKDDYYRIYAALLVREVLSGASSASHNNHVVYSDDFGETWHTLGDVCVPGGDEAKVEELPDGTIIISSRKSYGRYFNIFTFTDVATAQGSWSTAVASHGQTGGIAFGANTCNGELMKVRAIRKSDGQECDLMLQSVPTGDKREKVSFYYKEMSYGSDGSNTYTPTTLAQDWTKGLQVTDRGSAYSTYTIQADSRIGFFYEESPNDYCMVYVPLTLEEITGNKYSLTAEPTKIAPTVVPQVPTLVYDLMGRQVEIPSKGIYIVNGTKRVF